MNKRIKEQIREKITDFIFRSKLMSEKTNIMLRHIDYVVSSQSNKNKKVLYTCITGNYVPLLLHKYVADDYDYVCFTDSETLLNYNYYGAWKIKPLAFSKLDNTLNNRWHKTHPHILFPKYEESIYIDGNICLNSSYFIRAAEEKKMDIVVPRHWRDDCIYKECDNVMEVIVPSGGEKRENVERMKDFLEKNNMPHNYGLNENNFLYRKHNNSSVITIMEEWWDFIEHYTKRDQLSFAYILWKNGIRPEEISIPNLRNADSKDVLFICHRKTRS
ncbi:MAG: DUF616 domain-containing protein [Treponema sp.]|nr:DUF616 domain-containing protein [Treponema sp.]